VGVILCFDALSLESIIVIQLQKVTDIRRHKTTNVGWGRRPSLFVTRWFKLRPLDILCLLTRRIFVLSRFPRYCSE
jgi:hypothetical protein